MPEKFKVGQTVFYANDESRVFVRGQEVEIVEVEDGGYNLVKKADGKTFYVFDEDLSVKFPYTPEAQ
jgi:hypothetical protein